jgi:hypothetical protein
MESHLFKIDTWEFIKGVFTYAFWFIWLFIKMIWPFLLVMILIAILLRLLKSWIKKRKNKIGLRP